MSQTSQDDEKTINKISFKTSNIRNTLIAPEMVVNRNCENFVGAAQIPLGIAGPLQIARTVLAETNGRKSETRNYWLPLATTEGALVASVNRGCKAIGLSEGVKVYVKNAGVTRAPLFKVKDLEEGRKLITFIKSNLETINNFIQENEPYIKLFKVEPRLVGKNVWLRCFFDTNEAMGMNMATVACQRIAGYIKKELNIDCLALSGNLCVDKKPSWLNFTTGRGKKVWAEAVIKKEVVEKILKTIPEKIVQVVQKKCHLGSMVSGSLGFNAHFANIVAAIFLATGQDIAHVVEGSVGITEAEVEKKGDLYFSVYLPSLMIGTVGGGTGLPTQKEALGILGFDKPEKGDSRRLAGIIGAAVLAGELSLIAAIAAGDLAKAHQKLGRGKKKRD